MARTLVGAGFPRIRSGFRETPHLSERVELKWAVTGWRAEWAYVYTAPDELIYRYLIDVGTDEITKEQTETPAIHVVIRENALREANRPVRPDGQRDNITTALVPTTSTVNMRVRGAQYSLATITPYIAPSAQQEFLRLLGAQVPGLSEAGFSPQTVLVEIWYGLVPEDATTEDEIRLYILGSFTNTRIARSGTRITYGPVPEAGERFVVVVPVANDLDELVNTGTGGDEKSQFTRIAWAQPLAGQRVVSYHTPPLRLRATETFRITLEA